MDQPDMGLLVHMVDLHPLDHPWLGKVQELAESVVGEHEVPP